MLSVMSLLIACIGFSDLKFDAPVKIKAGGEPISVETGHAAPRVIDWNGDGVPDLLVGTCQPTKKPDGSRGPTGGPVWLCLGKKKE
jgi:hypothetical protein